MTSFVIFVHATFKQLDINAYISYFKFQIMKFSIHCRYKLMPQFSETCMHLHPLALLIGDYNSEHAFTAYLIYHTRTQNENEFKLPQLLQMEMVTMLH